MRFAITALAVVALTACQGAPAEEAAFEGTPYGEPLTLSEVTHVSTILDNPEQYVGERVLVEGMVVAVCEMKGCWMDIASDRAYEKIQVKVDDGVIVFPVSARGRQALVEGVVEILELTEEQAIAQAQHRAEELGEEFDPSSVPSGPQTTYRIRGLGAVVAD